MKLFDVKDKKIIIVGGSGDIGLSLVKGFSELGSKIAVIDIKDRISKLKLKKTKFFQADIQKEVEIKTSFNNAVEFLGSLDVLINCAGIQIRNNSEKFLLNDWKKIIDINLTATFIFSQLAGVEMLKNNYGRIIHFSSIISIVGGQTIPAYAASKGGVSQLTKALSNEWAKHGINVNAIAPGYIKTSLNTNLINNEIRYKKIIDHIPMGRWGNPDELLGLTVFLSSEASSYITGSILPIDGGYISW